MNTPNTWSAATWREKQGVAASTAIVRITLGQESHTVVSRWTMWRDTVEVDGRLVEASLNGVAGTHRFFITDSERELPASVEVAQVDFHYEIRRVEVGGYPIPLADYGKNPPRYG
ncbi:hypothetical protein [Streptomyces spectabilis]|uniref:Uncharacterized protein n=1 Tax=Streptomyces spectabilis TaxID=68270 RepID=A0A516REX7_STRST|nr:hypothetical protein [Streptomyces spectabilis]QDQ14209.1 hypothetical protein FH965_29545 [Streptomyces spectabilis]